MSELHDAVLAGEEERAREIANARPELRGQRDDGGLLAATRALYAGRRALAEAILPPDERLDIFESAAFGRLERMRQLLDEDPKRVNDYSPDGYMPVHLACFSGGVEATRLLVERGAELRGWSTNAQVKVYPLGTAAFSGDVDSARVLLEAGADPDAPGQGGFTPLHVAASNGNEALVRLLLEYGADSELALPDGRTAAQLAHEAGHGGCARLLGQT